MTTFAHDIVAVPLLGMSVCRRHGVNDLTSNINGYL